MKTISFLSLILVLSACEGGGGNRFDVATELGELGNRQVQKQFESYVAKKSNGGCVPQGRGPRLIISGFGPFFGSPYNISGTVVRYLADGTLQPAQIPKGEFGGEAIVKTMVLGKTEVEVCFLTLSVQWDLAAAILIYEATRFQPELILMTGQGSDDFAVEKGATNITAGTSGYGADGKSLGATNLPQDNWILRNYATGFELPMSWNNVELAATVRNDVKGLGYATRASKLSNEVGQYICNNVSFVLLHAALNRSTQLAGGLLELPSPNFPTPPTIGFVHLPAVAWKYPKLEEYLSGVEAWGKIMLKLAEVALRR